MLFLDNEPTVGPPCYDSIVLSLYCICSTVSWLSISLLLPGCLSLQMLIYKFVGSDLKISPAVTALRNCGGKNLSVQQKKKDEELSSEKLQKQAIAAVAGITVARASNHFYYHPQAAKWKVYFQVHSHLLWQNLPSLLNHCPLRLQADWKKWFWVPNFLKAA